MENKTLAIIGGGVSGICSAKWAKHEGYQVTVFEKNDTLGGNWRDDSIIWPNMETNTSKYALSLYDYRLGGSDSVYITKEQFYRHIKSYVKDFEVEKLFKFSCKVTCVKRVGQKVQITFNKNNTEYKELFDYVIICTGMFGIPEYQNYGDSKTDIKIIHSKDYKYPHEYIGKNVMVIGNSHSGNEICADICKSAKKVYNLYRRPYWIFNKFEFNEKLNKTVPVDIFRTKRPPKFDKSIPLSEINKFKNNRMISNSNQNKIHKHLAIEPDCEEFPHFSISEKYLDFVKMGLIQPIRGGVVSLGQNSLSIETFEKELLELKDIDVIILCFGYRTDLSFLDQEILEIIEYNQDDRLMPFILYKGIYHPKLPNIGFVGFGRGLLLAIGEFQARCVLRHFRNPFPNITDYDLTHSKGLRSMTKRPQSAKTFYDYFYELAEDLNSQPDYDKIKGVDPELYHMITNGPFLPHVFWINENDINSKKNIDEIKRINKSLSKGPKF
jgi:cation diffusion facilitator CzcD-associated flavoprotein CzcO